MFTLFDQKMRNGLLTMMTTLSLSACGEIEEIKTAQRYSAAEFTQVIEPLFAELDCGGCHKNPLGGFKWDSAGTPAASDDNLLNVQRAMNIDLPEASPMLVRLTPPKSGHPLYFCPQSCLYQYLVKWGSVSVGPIDYSAIECDNNISLEDVRVGECSSE